MITSTAPELAVEIEAFSDRSPGLFYALLFFLKSNSPMHKVLIVPVRTPQFPVPNLVFLH